MMSGSDVSADQVIAELINMGFEFDDVKEAIEAVGPHLHDTVDFILNRSCNDNIDQTGNITNSLASTNQTSHVGRSSTSKNYPQKLKQPNISDHLPSSRRDRRGTSCLHDSFSLDSKRSIYRHLGDQELLDASMDHKLEPSGKLSPLDANASKCIAKLKDKAKVGSQQNLPSFSFQVQEAEMDWEEKVTDILQKHFGYSSLKDFQKDAIEAWVNKQDCLVLAATGSGKSLCFQLPAVLTGKVVVVISPLISLMHDQCLKLAKHGISACFLGSGQPDNSVERKALHGMFNIVYVCPETIFRLIQPLKRLAENRGIALFAIDEVHCVSKWGHDFRPDYRRLSVLRDNFGDIPLMALTATATIPVRQDIINSLHLSVETKIVLTSFFRPNLRFSVKHSRTNSTSSYFNDFQELIEIYTLGMLNRNGSNQTPNNTYNDSDSSHESSDESIYDADEGSLPEYDFEYEEHAKDVKHLSRETDGFKVPLKGEELSIEFLEDELDNNADADDFDVFCGEFPENCPAGSQGICVEPEISGTQESLDHGPTIIYVPTRKETLKLADFFCRSGVRAAAYHAKLPKSHLRNVHHQFHENSLEVVVATIAFGMGIDKSNVRRIIHYGWPQSLQAYYQEAGRAGRDGKLSDCILYANLSRIPTLLPSERSEEQTRHAYRLLSDCFRYGMNTATCRAKILVDYFGEKFSYGGCFICDICIAGPPKIQNFKEEADIFIQTLKNCDVPVFWDAYYDGPSYSESSVNRIIEKPKLNVIVHKIKEQFQKFSLCDQLWWRGLARILEKKGYIIEGGDMARVSIQFPEVTEKGLKFLQSVSEETLDEYPEADMLLSMQMDKKPYSSFAEWGRGWADPNIRRQRLERRRCGTMKRKWRSGRDRHAPSTARGRLAAKLSEGKSGPSNLFKNSKFSNKRRRGK